MGGVGFGTIAQAVVGVGGIVSSTISANRQADEMNRLMNVGEEQRGRVRGLDDYFLGGGKASALNIPGFQDQFAEVDYAVQEQLRNIDAQAKKSQQMLADTIPSGGAKLRALADLSMKTQEERGKVLRESQSRKRDLDTELTNQYLQMAMNRQQGVGYDTQMQAALRAYEGNRQDIQAIGSALGQLSGQGGQTSQSGYEYLPPESQAVESASMWDGGDKDKYMSTNYPWVKEKKLGSGQISGAY
jgi:hypothetical protein